MGHEVRRNRPRNRVSARNSVSTLAKPCTLTRFILIYVDVPLAVDVLEVEGRRLGRLHLGQLCAHDLLPVGAQAAGFVKGFGTVDLEVLEIKHGAVEKRGHALGDAHREIGGKAAQKLAPNIVVHKFLPFHSNNNYTTLG